MCSYNFYSDRNDLRFDVWYHKDTDGCPVVPTTAEENVEMPNSGYAPGPRKTIMSMERKAKSIINTIYGSASSGGIEKDGTVKC